MKNKEDKSVIKESVVQNDSNQSKFELKYPQLTRSYGLRRVPNGLNMSLFVVVKIENGVETIVSNEETRGHAIAILASRVEDDGWGSEDETKPEKMMKVS